MFANMDVINFIFLIVFRYHGGCYKSYILKYVRLKKEHDQSNHKCGSENQDKTPEPIGEKECKSEMKKADGMYNLPTVIL